MLPMFLNKRSLKDLLSIEESFFNFFKSKKLKYEFLKKDPKKISLDHLGIYTIKDNLKDKKIGEVELIIKNYRTFLAELNKSKDKDLSKLRLTDVILFYPNKKINYFCNFQKGSKIDATSKSQFFIDFLINFHEYYKTLSVSNKDPKYKNYKIGLIITDKDVSDLKKITSIKRTISFRKIDKDLNLIF